MSAVAVVYSNLHAVCTLSSWFMGVTLVILLYMAWDWVTDFVFRPPLL